MKSSTIRPMIHQDITEVVALHRRSLTGTLSSRIGSNYLKYLYRRLLQDSAHTALVYYQDDQIIGVLTATKNLIRTSQKISPLFSPTAIVLILMSILTMRVGMGELFEQLFFEKNLLKNFDNPYITILTLFVSPDHQRKHIGRTLVQSLLTVYKSQSLAYVYVDTLQENTSAQAFYIAMGATPQKRVAKAMIFRWNL